MNATTQPNTPKASSRGFDDARRAQVLALIKLGCSRRLAGDLARCAHTTISRAAERDPVFARQLADAECHVDVASLTRIQEASAENKNWRAAAWMLERRHPEEFGRRAPHTFGGDQIMALLAKILTYTLPRVLKEQHKEFIADFDRTLREVEAQTRQPDRWRKMAGKDCDHPSRHVAEEYRSPYEHPLWDEPNSFDQLWELYPKDEAKQTAWIEGLNYRDFETFRHGVRAHIAHFRAERPQLLSDARELQREEEELAAAEEREGDAAEDAAVDEPRAEAADGASVPTDGTNEVKEAIVAQELAPRTSVQQPVVAQTVPLPEEAAAIDLPAAAEKRPQAVAVQSADQPLTLDAPAAGPQALCEDCEDFTVPRSTPPTAATHQAYQEWLAKQLAVLRHNFLLANGLQQQFAAAPAATNQASGAYEAQLIKWTEAMAR